MLGRVLPAFRRGRRLCVIVAALDAALAMGRVFFLGVHGMQRGRQGGELEKRTERHRAMFTLAVYLPRMRRGMPCVLSHFVVEPCA